MESGIAESELCLSVNLSSLNNLTVKQEDTGFVVALTDDEGFETVRGYGVSPEEAMNDLHRNLI